jgi:hypothetical protein
MAAPSCGVLRLWPAQDTYRAFQTIPNCIPDPARAEIAGWGWSFGAALLLIVYGCRQTELHQVAYRIRPRRIVLLASKPINSRNLCLAEPRLKRALSTLL